MWKSLGFIASHYTSDVITTTTRSGGGKEIGVFSGLVPTELQSQVTGEKLMKHLLQPLFTLLKIKSC